MFILTFKLAPDDEQPEEMHGASICSDKYSTLWYVWHAMSLKYKIEIRDNHGMLLDPARGISPIYAGNDF